MEQGHHTANEMTANLHAISALSRARLAFGASINNDSDYTQFIRTRTSLIQLRFHIALRTTRRGRPGRMKLVSCALNANGTGERSQTSRTARLSRGR
jgi:hypothetical protein